MAARPPCSARKSTASASRRGSASVSRLTPARVSPDKGSIPARGAARRPWLAPHRARVRAGEVRSCGPYGRREQAPPSSSSSWGGHRPYRARVRAKAFEARPCGAGARRPRRRAAGGGGGHPLSCIARVRQGAGAGANGAATVRPRRSRRICRQTGAWSFVHRRPGSSALSPTGRVHRHPELRGRYSPRSPRNQTASRGPAALAPRAGSSASGPRWALASLGWESQDEGRYSSFVYSCSAQPGEERERITACRSTGRGDQSGVQTSASPTPGSTALHLCVPSRSGRGHLPLLSKNPGRPCSSACGGRPATTARVS